MKFSYVVLLVNICFLLCSCDEKKNQQEFVDKIVIDSTEISIETVISDLNEPWDIEWGKDNWIWITELNNGLISKVNPATGEKKELLMIPDLYDVKVGMLSMVLYPDMETKPYVFVNYISQKDSTIISKLVRYTFRDDTLYNSLTLLEIPGNTGHNGSRLAIAPDGKLIWATGDASCCADGDITNEKITQDSELLNGKILRLNIDGSIPSDNPIPNNPVWAFGFRVPQGLTYSSQGYLYSSEHGAATDDEINLIRKGQNYGYPAVTGFCDSPDEESFCTAHDVVEPLQAWTPTIAPAGIDYYNSTAIPEFRNSILLTTLKTQTFRILKLNERGNEIISETIYLRNKFGRLRDVCVSPKGDIFISTSNRDWNPAKGYPIEHDDRIIKLSKIRTIEDPKRISKRSESLSASKLIESSGRGIYIDYCASCHKKDGEGIEDIYPPLKKNPTVNDDMQTVIQVVLNGSTEPIEAKDDKYDQLMPSFGFLSNQEVADVVTYIRSSFGNQAGEVTSDDVSKFR